MACHRMRRVSRANNHTWLDMLAQYVSKEVGLSYRELASSWIRTSVDGFKVHSDNHYTIEASVPNKARHPKGLLTPHFLTYTVAAHVRSNNRLSPELTDITHKTLDATCKSECCYRTSTCDRMLP